MNRQLALISVSDKTGLVDFGQGLLRLGFEIISTGGTLRALTDAGVAAHPVADVIGLPEILGGRVKTLHPTIFGGILARRNDMGDMDILDELGIAPISVVAVNMKQLAPAAASAREADEERLERIDIGGPALLRAAAKNYPDVYVAVDPADYPAVLEALGSSRQADYRHLRRLLAAKVFQRTAEYDRQVHAWLAGELKTAPDGTTAQPLPGGQPTPRE